VSIFTRKPIRCLITPGILSDANFSTEHPRILKLICAAIDRGVELVQIREKNLNARDVFSFASASVRLASGSGTKIMVNERFDIAMAAGASGVQLTSRSMPVSWVRPNVPKGFLIGASAHSREDVIDARAGDADFAMFGNVFESPGKPEPAGLEVLSDICSAAGDFPVIAVGGINGSNWKSVIDAGAAGFAAIRYLNEFVSIGE